MDEEDGEELVFDLTARPASPHLAVTMWAGAANSTAPSRPRTDPASFRPPAGVVALVVVERVRQRPAADIGEEPGVERGK